MVSVPLFESDGLDVKNQALQEDPEVQRERGLVERWVILGNGVFAAG